MYWYTSVASFVSLLSHLTTVNFGALTSGIRLIGRLTEFIFTLTLIQVERNLDALRFIEAHNVEHGLQIFALRNVLEEAFQLESILRDQRSKSRQFSSFDASETCQTSGAFVLSVLCRKTPGLRCYSSLFYPPGTRFHRGRYIIEKAKLFT